MMRGRSSRFVSHSGLLTFWGGDASDNYLCPLWANLHLFGFIASTTVLLTYPKEFANSLKRVFLNTSDLPGDVDGC